MKKPGGKQPDRAKGTLTMCILCEGTTGSKPAAMAIPPRPAALPVIPENIPAELTALNNWVLWRFTWKAKEQKYDKPPLQFSGQPAKANDPQTWTGFDKALYWLHKRGFDGIGYVPTEVDGLVFLDLDCVVRPDGTLGGWSPELRSLFAGEVPEPAELIAQLGSYAELSPSGRGIRIVCKGSLPKGRRKIGGKGNGCPDGFEAYSHAHYLTITGQRLAEAPAAVADCTEKLAALHAAVFGKVESKPAAAVPGPLPVTLLDDLAVIERARLAKNGERFSKLWNGDASDYPSHPSRSEADFALASKLAFYCGPNPDQIERLMRQSGLARSKWARPEYLFKTITKSLEGRTEFYTRELVSSIAGALRSGDSCVYSSDTVRGNSNNNTVLPLSGDAATSNRDKPEWAVPRRVREKYDSNPWDCPKAFGAAGQAAGSPVLITATCRKRSCLACASYWRLKTYDRFGFHLYNHDGQLYTDTVADWDWKAVLEAMRRRAKKLGVPVCFVTIRDDSDTLTVLASVPIRADIARPVELADALKILESAIDEAAGGPRPVNACRKWGKLPHKKEVERVPGGCSPSSFRATLLAWKVQSIDSGRFIMCDRPGLFLDSEGKLDEQLRCDFWREAETRDWAGDAAADETRNTLAAARERRKQDAPPTDPETCQHVYEERTDESRPGWLVTSCTRCGRFRGRRPK
jgi:hypothetical protein